MRYLSLFSGIGGFEYGLAQSIHTFENVGFSEIDRYAKSVYQKHYPNHIDLGDATEIDPTEIEDFDFLVGGFPCQAFSLSGKRQGFNDCRGTLFFEIARICAEKKPKYLLFENVKGLLSHDGGRTFKTMLGVLSELGYDVEWEIYNSKSFGTAQNRERLYIKGYSRTECRGEILSQKRDCREISLQGIKKLIDGKQATSVYSMDGTSVSLTALGGGMGAKTGLYAEPTIKTHHFERQVRKRVHEVDYDELSSFLREHKKASGLSTKAIAAQVNKPTSEVEHWFRTDKFFAPPTDDVWLQLKEILGIESDKYDDFMLEFEWVDGVFDMDKRANDVDGLSSTLTTKSESLIVDPKIKVVGNLSNTGHKGENVLSDEGLASTLTATNYKHPLRIKEDVDVEKVWATTRKFNGSTTDGDYTPTLTASMGTGGNNVPVMKLKTNTEKGYDEVTAGDGVRLCHPTSTKARGRTQKGQTGALSTGSDWGTVERDYRIRRLTPKECERLQAFPDDWTKYGKDGELISDTQRYKCLGNAVTTTVVTYIANTMFNEAKS